MRFAHCLSFSKKKGQLVYSIVLFAGFIFLLLCKSYAQLPVANALQLGGFRCIELKPYANDHYFEMYEMGEWIHSSFRQDVWKRLGVPYWYSENQGDIRVAKDADGLPDEVVIPLRNAKAKELCFLGHVGGGFDTSLDVETRIGEYELIYANGKKEIIPLIAGKNVADTAYGHFVDSAFFAYGQVDTNAVKNKNRPLTYHLGEALAIDPKIQLMTYSYKVAHPGVELKELRFRCTKSKTFIVLQALTLLQQGERLNPLVYQGKTLNPTPASAPAATPSWLEGSRSKERIVKLDGQWQFRIDPGNKGMRKEWFHDKTATHWRSIDVPGQWFVQGINYHGVAWYRRKLLVPKTFQGEKLLLRFERVDYDARVWVNGKYIGRHYGAYQSFNLDATDAILKGENNEIVVRVESPIDPGVQFYKTIAKGNAMDDIAQAYGEEGSMGGIYRSVFLIATGKAKIEDVWVRSEISQDLKKATARLAFSLTNAEPVSVKCVLKESGGSNRRSFTQTIESSNADSVLKEVTFDIPYPRLWYPWEQGKPELHELTIEAWSGNKLLAQHKSRVGIKQVEFKRAEHAVYVNGHRMFIKGMLFDDPHWQSLMDRRGYQYRLQLMKSANLNEVRLTTHASSPEFYELADEMGMLVWQETPLQWWYSHTEPIRQQILQVVSETIRQTRGHASVVGYSAWNEGGQEDFSDRVVALMQSLDSTKVISRASGHGDFDVHVYPTQVRNITRNTFFWSGFKFPFISETGAYGMPDIASLEEMFGKDLFKYNGAEYFWDPFTRWGFDDGPAYADLPLPMMWPVDKLKKTILDRAESSGRFYWQVMKSMYEVTRGQMFNPTTSCVYCRFDDAFPAAWLSLVNFVGRPLKAYYGVQQACQAVLPILWFDAEGAEDIRVINEYWKIGRAHV